MKATNSTPSKPQNLEHLRHQIDKVDTQIVELLSKRQQLVIKVAHLKKRLHLPITQKLREAELLRSKRSLAKKNNLNPNFIERLLNSIMAESRHIQTKINRGTKL